MYHVHFISLKALRFFMMGLMLLVLSLAFVGLAEAKTVKRGVQATPLSLAWTIVGGSGSCDGTFDSPAGGYPSSADGIRTAWVTSHSNASSPLVLRAAGTSVLAPAGTYVFRCTDAGSGQFDTDTLIVTDCLATEYWNGSDCVAKLSQSALTITSTATTYSATTPTMTLTTSGGSGSGAVSYTVVSGGTAGCSVAGSTLTYTSIGTCTVQATKAADTTYNAASSPVTTINVSAAPVPTINSFTGPATVTSGSAPTLTWNVSNATACTINPGAYTTSPVLTGSHAMPAISANTTYTLSCMNGGSGPTTGTVTVTVADPDLVVSASTFPSGTTLYQNTGYTLSGTVRNSGGAAAGVFSNNFSYNPGTGWVNPAAGYTAKGALAAGATAGADSYTFTPSALGSVQLQYCVDSYNQVSETASGELGNCVQSATYTVVVAPPAAPTGFVLNTGAAGVPACGGRITAAWNAVTGATSYKVSVDGGAFQDIGNVTSYQFNSLVPGSSHTIQVVASNSTADSAPATATANASAICSVLAVGNCTIADLARTCNTTVTWDITGATSPSIYNLTRSQTVPGTSMATGTAVAITLERSTTFGNESNGNNVIESRDGATTLDSRTAVASCGATSFFHTTASENRCQPVPNILITPNPAWIRSGDQANLTFGILANYPGVTCTFTGAMSTAAPINHTASASRTNYVRTTDPLTAAQMVRVSCTAPGLATPITGEVRVNVLPDVQEI